MAFETKDWPKPDDVTRALPYALGPEKSLLSSMLQDPQEYIGVAIEEKLTQEHFYLPSHSMLFGFLIELFEGGNEVELVSLVQRLLDRGLLDRVGGPSALTDLYTYAPSPGHFRHHLQHVKDKFVLRSIIQNSNEAIAQAYDAPDEVAELLDSVEAKVLAIRDLGSSTKFQTIKQSAARVVDKFKARIEKRPEGLGLMTGFEDLDRMTGGLKSGDMFVIGARPSMGKTAIMLNIADHLGINLSLPGLILSAEMSADALTERLIFTRAKFSLSSLSRGHIPDKGDLMRIQRATMEVANSPIYIDDTSGPSISYIQAKARRMRRDHGIAWIAGDYCQLMKSGTKQAQFSREREVAEISAGWKAMAKDLGVPVILLAQINRESEKRTGKALGMPKMSDLRESGALEQDADMVGLMHRPVMQAVDDEEREAMAGRAQLILAKNRNGETGTVYLTFIAELMRFESGQPWTEEPPAAKKKTESNPFNRGAKS